MVRKKSCRGLTGNELLRCKKSLDEPEHGYKAHLVSKELEKIEKKLNIKFTTARYNSLGHIEQVPKYVGRYFITGTSTPRKKVLDRLKELDDSRWGYKTKEYKDLKRYVGNN